MTYVKGKFASAADLIFFAAYAGFVLALAYGGIKHTLSVYYSESAFRSGSESEAGLAVAYLPENPYAHETYGEVLLRNEEIGPAVAAFEQAIALRPNDYVLWLRYGSSLRLANDIEGAEKALGKALALAPNYSQTNLHMGMMLLKAERHDEAFKHFTKAADRDPDLYPEVMHRARSLYPGDPVAIENALDPDSRQAKKIVARYLIKHNMMTEGVRSFLMSDGLSGDEKNEFVRYLIHKENFEVARDVWLSRQPQTSRTLDETVVDGGFEEISGIDASGLGWQVDQRISSTSVARNSTKSHSGSSSLEVKFAGNVELGRDIVSQLIFVEPGRRYVLGIRILSPELVSAGLPAIVAHGVVTDDLLGRSDEIKAAGRAWVEYKIDFTPRRDPVVRIGLQRPNCNSSPCPIFGQLFLDDVYVAVR